MIIALLSRDPELHQADLAKAIHLSQPAVGARIKRLTKTGVLSKQYGVNLRRAGLFVAKVDASTKHPDELLRMFEGCPAFLDGYITLGSKNVCLFFAMEDLASLEALVDCHVNKNHEVENVQHSIIMSSHRELVFPVNPVVGKREQPAACGAFCNTCSLWKGKGGKCLGCPSTPYYQGHFWG